MLTEFGLDYRGLDKIGMQQTLVAHFKRLETLGKRAVLVIDEAQVLTPEVLEELRLFSNMNAGRTMLLQTILVGQLNPCATRLRRPEMRQLAQRVAVDYLLTPLDKEQTEAYIRHRLHIAGPGHEGLFTVDACEAIYNGSGGIPRVINLLCDMCPCLWLRRPGLEIDATIGARSAGGPGTRGELTFSASCRPV